MSEARRPYAKPYDPYGLTWREKEVRDIMITALEPRLACEKLGIEHKTLLFHLTNIYSKYQVSTLPQLIIKCHNDALKIKGVSK